jgi:hypothetical protein
LAVAFLRLLVCIVVWFGAAFVRADLAGGFAAGLWAGGIVGAVLYLSMIWADHLEKERAAAWEIERERQAKRAAWLADLPPLPNEGRLTNAWALCSQLETSGAWFRAQMPKDGGFIQIPVVDLTNADLLILQNSFGTRATEDPGLNADPRDRDRCYRTKWPEMPSKPRSRAAAVRSKT